MAAANSAKEAVKAKKLEDQKQDHLNQIASAKAEHKKKMADQKQATRVANAAKAKADKAGGNVSDPAGDGKSGTAASEPEEEDGDAHAGGSLTTSGGKTQEEKAKEV